MSMVSVLCEVSDVDFKITTISSFLDIITSLDFLTEFTSSDYIIVHGYYYYVKYDLYYWN